MSKQELLIGCGSNHDKRLTLDGTAEWTNLTTLDYHGMHKPDIEWDLMDMPLPFPDNFFDEIHAYEVLEHTGAQGDYKLFFHQFTRFWEVLKPDGLFLATIFGRDTLDELRSALLEAEIAESGGAGPRVSPFTDVRDAGALLQRADRKSTRLNSSHRT